MNIVIFVGECIPVAIQSLCGAAFTSFYIVVRDPMSEFYKIDKNTSEWPFLRCVADVPDAR